MTAKYIMPRLSSNLKLIPKQEKKFIATLKVACLLLEDPLPIFMPEFSLVDGRILEESARDIVFDRLSASSAFKRVKF